MLHKLRRATVGPGRDRLSGVVEVDETYWGVEERGLTGRLTNNKMLPAAAVEEDGRKRKAERSAASGPVPSRTWPGQPCMAS